MVGGSVQIKENVRGGQGKKGRWRGDNTKLGKRCVLDLIKVRLHSSSIHKYLFRVFTIPKVLLSCSGYLAHH